MVKKASSTIRLDLAQYREMEVFTQFASDLDETTKNQLLYGQGLMQILKQEQYAPLADFEQVIILVVAMSKTLLKVNSKEIKNVMSAILKDIKDNAPDLIRELQITKDLSKNSKERIRR